MKRLTMLAVPFGAALLLLLAACDSEPTETAPPPRVVRSRYAITAIQKLLPEIFPKQTIDEVDKPIADVLDEKRSGNYIVITGSFEPSPEDTRALFDFVRRGNSAFIAAEHFTSPFEDSLNLATGSTAYGADSVCFSFTSPTLGAPKSYCLSFLAYLRYFSRFDTTGARIAGIGEHDAPMFVIFRRGAGRLYLCSVPYAFVDGAVLDTATNGYAFAALSYMPVAPVIWDEHYRGGKTVSPSSGSGMGGLGSGGGGDDSDSFSPLHFILSHEALRWALYLLLAGVVLFIIFMGRRRQRPIPIISPLPNTTLDFVGTVGQLYYHHGDHRNIAEKRITYFLDHIRVHYGVNTSERTDEFFHALAARSGVDRDEVRTVFTAIDGARSSVKFEERDLAALNGAIERFLATSTRRAASR